MFSSTLRRSRLSALFCPLALAAISCLAVPLATHAAEPLVWKFKVGAGNRYRMTQKMEMTMNLGAGGAEGQEMTNVIDLSWVVDKVNDDGSAQLTQTVDRMHMTVAPKGRDKIEFDTDSTDEPQGFAAMLAPLFRAMTRAKFTLTMSPRGKISEVKVPEELIAALAASPGGAVMGDMATAKGMEEMMSRMSFELPETLEVGKTSTISAEMANPVLGKQTIKMIYKYVGPREVDGAAMEVFEPTLDIAFDGGPATAKISDQKSSGEVLFNRTAGRLESTAIDHSMSLALSIGGMATNQTLKQSMEMKWLPEEKSK